jgi:hypothetical protein
MMKHLLGLDHVVVLARDLDRAAEAWRRLGFTLSPRGTHSAHLGTANYTLMFGDDYIELLGVVTPTEHNAPSRARLIQVEGLERAAFTTDDAAAGAAELRRRGIPASGPLAFGRPVDLPGGEKTEARFRTFFWPVAEAPGEVRLFACEHLTRETVWIPQLQQHANTAQRIVEVEVLVADPRAGAAQLARLIDAQGIKHPDGSFMVPTGSGRGNFVFLDRATLAKRHPGIALDSLPSEGGVGLRLAVGDLEAAAAIVGPALTVPPQAASGVILTFVPAGSSAPR